MSWRRNSFASRGGLRVAFACLTTLAIGLLTTTTVAAQAPPAGITLSFDELEARWPSFNAQQMVAAIEQVTASGEFDFADRLLQRPESRRVIAAVDITFLNGVLRKLQGRPREAIQLFRAVLASHPNHNGARVGLAHALFQIEDDDNARQHFQLAIAGAQSDPNIEKFAQSFIDQIEKRGRLVTSTYFGIAPSTNLNQASTAQVVYLNGLPFEIADANRAKAGVGVTSGASVGYRVPVAESLDIVPSASVNTKFYTDRRFNDVLLSASLGPRWRFDMGHVGFYATAGQRWMGDDGYATTFGGRLHTTMRLGALTIAAGDVVCERRRHDADWRGTDMRFQDGVGCQISGNVDHYLSNSSYVRVLGGAERDWLSVPHFSFSGWRGGVGLFRELPWGVSLYGQAQFTKRDYAGVFPGTIIARHDQRLDLSATVTKRDFVMFGFAPALQYTFTRNISNVQFYDYNAHGVTLTWTRSF